MEPHIDLITLAVSDLELSLEFYRDGLGLESAELIGRAATATGRLPD